MDKQEERVVMIKLFAPFVSWESRWNVLKVLGSGYLSAGKTVRRFEEEFAAKFGFKEVVSVNSGTSAIEIAYTLCDFQKGDEVIVPVLTCTATSIPLVRRGVKIVFADIDYDLNISIEDVERKITPKTKAIVFVHFGGNNRGLRQLMVLARRHGIRVIEDAAQAVGSDYWGKADFTCVSTGAIKTLTSGDGGFIICKAQKDHEKAKRLRWYGYDREKKLVEGDTDLTEAGFKMNMNEIAAAIGLGNLHSIDGLIAHRIRLADIYREYGIQGHAWLAQGFADDFKCLQRIYADEGIEIGQHHYRNDKYTLLKKFKSKCPVMDETENKYFFVPYHHGVTEPQAHKIGKIYERNA